MQRGAKPELRAPATITVAAVGSGNHLDLSRTASMVGLRRYDGRKARWRAGRRWEVSLLGKTSASGEWRGQRQLRQIRDMEEGSISRSNFFQWGGYVLGLSLSKEVKGNLYIENLISWEGPDTCS